MSAPRWLPGGAPTANMIYKLVEWTGYRCRSAAATRNLRRPQGSPAAVAPDGHDHRRSLTPRATVPTSPSPTDIDGPAGAGGKVVADTDISAARKLWQPIAQPAVGGSDVSHGEPAIPTTQIPARHP
ncbi:nicotinate phosphoribosyltransferase domain protein [Mycobacterium xenopi 4042]|uniref:Nicotinate phosphoribosyltransferase domain protein n=1 Tax=Mycobacterium xenopi 4042 TaxID=1299334 RepID=X8CJT3_MYCXE|nr:nicotinate phosphoribosyltransferase domain protein [Mycobacterium xenopi 4042]